MGIVLSIGNISYYAPMESPKPNHHNIKSGGPVLKIDNGNLGIIGFNNMIPVRTEHLVEYDISSEKDKKYQNLLLKQIAWCNKNKAILYKRAQSTYKKAVIDRVPFYVRICCNFKRLEQECNK